MNTSIIEDLNNNLANFQNQRMQFEKERMYGRKYFQNEAEISKTRFLLKCVTAKNKNRWQVGMFSEHIYSSTLNFYDFAIGFILISRDLDKKGKPFRLKSHLEISYYAKDGSKKYDIRDTELYFDTQQEAIKHIPKIKEQYLNAITKSEIGQMFPFPVDNLI